jgi:hypothetical protein
MDSDGIDRLFTKGDRAVLEWTLSSTTDYAQFSVGDEATSDDIASALFAALSAMQQERDRAIEIVHLLVGERTKIREFMAAQNRSQRQDTERQGSDRLFSKVGLDLNCPSFVLDAVRRAYRVKLHPDKHPPGRRAEAERQFKEAEAVFEEISRLRNAERH